MAVLSFFGKFQIEKIYLSCLWRERGIKTMSLQVPCSPLFSTLWTNHPGKRVLPFISRRNFKASMTVEAAFVLPLFVFLVVALLMPMKVLDTQRKIQTKVEMVCEDLSLYAYVSDAEIGEKELEAKRSEYMALFSDIAAWGWLQKEVGGYGKEVFVEQTSVPDENGDIVLKVNYRERTPVFSGLGNVISVDIAAKRRGWTGISGKLKSEKDGVDTGNLDVEMVYVGLGMGRYHRKRECHYISNEYQAVSLEAAKSMKDEDGHRFTACSSCEEMIGDFGTVYITPGGRHYHGTTECRAMVSYVRKVPLSEVMHLGACSYCGER